MNSQKSTLQLFFIVMVLLISINSSSQTKTKSSDSNESPYKLNLTTSTSNGAFFDSDGDGVYDDVDIDDDNDGILDDKKNSSIDVEGAKIYNVKDIYFQRAPLPYQTISDGNWTDTTTWQYGSEWDITSKQNNSDDASIVHIKNNISLVVF